MPDNSERGFALEVVRQLRDAGYESLWAGGCVRDALLGKEPKDYDIATSAEPEQVRELFGRKRTIPVGASFGVMTVLPPRGVKADPIEVATFRSDGAYVDGRRPESVCYTTAEEDASRRDFTINGMFFDPIEEKVIDYVGGEADLKAGILRAIGVAEQRIAEDRLRMLRAVRFASTLKFALDQETAEAVRRHASSISEVSPERIGAEIKRMLVDSERSEAIRLLRETNLLGEVFPSLATVSEDQLATIKKRLAKIAASEATPSLALAVLMVGVNEARVTGRIARELKWTNKEVDRAVWLLEHRNDLKHAEQRPWSEVQPLLAAEGGAELVALRLAMLDECDATDEFCRVRLSWPVEELDPTPLVVGADLIAAGLRPGPDFKSLLARARAYQLDGEVQDKEQSLLKLGIA